MYQLPHLSLAISGNSKVPATRWTKSESWRMEAKRLEVERAERLREVRVRDQLWEASGNIKESVEIIEGEVLREYSVVILRWQ